MNKKQNAHVEFNLKEATDHLNEAMTRLRKCVYAMNLTDKTMNELLDEQNQVGYSVIGDLATLKAVSHDIAYLQECLKRESEAQA